MFRSIPSRRLSSAPRSLLALSTPHTFSSNVGPKFKPLLLRQSSPTYLYHPRSLSVSKSLFSTTQLRPANEAEKAKLENERQNSLNQKLKVDLENVTRTSSTTPIFDHRPTNRSAQGGSDDDPDILRGLKSDLRVVKETFELKEVPKEVLYIGMGGLVPYVWTSLSTLYLAWDINYSADYGTGFLVNSDTAGNLLHILEPLQIGLGATILSFLGAVHWGLEMAEYGGKHPYKRYPLSILAPMLAWPTLMLPLDYALLAQFVGFTGMYFADSTATRNGWAPRWYMTYRFLLTFVVGASIVMTLVARGQIGDRIPEVRAPASYLQDLRDSQWENFQKEEEERRRNIREREIEGKKRKAAKEAAAAAEKKDKEEGEDDKGEGEDKKDTGKGDGENGGRNDEAMAGSGTGASSE